MVETSRWFVRSIVVGITILASSACSSGDDSAAECANLTGSRSAALEEPRCVGSAQSCSSFGVSSSESRSACAYQDGCYPDYDSSSCRGTATACSELGEVYCSYQVGCTWDDGGESDDPSSGDGPARSCGQQSENSDSGSASAPDAGGGSAPPPGGPGS